MLGGTVPGVEMGRFRTNFRSAVEARGRNPLKKKTHPSILLNLSNGARIGSRRYNFSANRAADFPEIRAGGPGEMTDMLAWFCLLMLCFCVLGPSRPRPGQVFPACVGMERTLIDMRLLRMFILSNEAGTGRRRYDFPCIFAALSPGIPARGT